MYPSIDVPFVLQTDASILGLAAVLSQQQSENRLHPVAFASPSLSKVERNYSVTETETFSVVWAVSHFHTYLYGHKVTVYADHSAVRAVLGTTSPNGKYAP